MEKLKNYILNGKGIGAIVLLCTALIFSSYYTWVITKGAQFSVPYVQQIIWDAAPISIVDGTVVVPENTIKEINLFGEGDEAFPFVIDTTTDTLDASKLPMGLYLTRSYFYSVQDDGAKSRRLSGAFELPKDDYTDYLYKSIKWVGLASFIIGFIFFFVKYLLLVLFYSFVAFLAEVLNKTTLDFDVKMRLNSVLLSGVLFLSLVAGFLGIYVNVFMFAGIMVVLQILLIKTWMPREA